MNSRSEFLACSHNKAMQDLEQNVLQKRSSLERYLAENSPFKNIGYNK